MQKKKKEYPKVKSNLHPRNRHRERYDFAQLVSSLPELAPFVTRNVYGDDSVDFADPLAVKMLNKALLKHYYNLDYWDIPDGYLCPPIPGRADYIHHMADLMCRRNYGEFPMGDQIRCVDIGVGANCVYPVIGNREYGWSFVGSDIDTVAIASANKIIEMNPFLKDKVEIRLQTNPKDIYFRIMQKDEPVDLSICNPPFHASPEAAMEGTLRKLNNLTTAKTDSPDRNFGGQSHELWCEGGEERFIREMIRQSRQFSGSCFWFSTLVSKQTHLKSAYEGLKKADAVDVQTLPMGQGSKISRVVAWTFLDKEQQRTWINTRWKGSKQG
ncbi:MAG: 23S rRNA (adenine1618-N6)-methyltransferase [Bacteroidetes bacterium]|nr:MAG: 23S rRNA (adenine1618-N6)-methyltransferase [Bacteroidota bacterium]